MKNLFILLGLLLFTSIVSAQTRLDFTLHVIDNHSNPVAGISVTLIETTNKKRINSSTNKEGVVAFQINYGSEWSLNVAEMKNCGYIEVPESGITEETKTITYDLKHYNRINRPFVDRSTFHFVTENQIKLKDLNYTKAQALVSLTILKENGSPLTNFPVNLTCFKLGKTFLGKTNTKGVANFIVPAKNEYEVDIDNVESVKYVDVVQSGVYALETTYEPTYIVENDVNDTIVQKLPNESNGTGFSYFQCATFHVITVKRWNGSQNHSKNNGFDKRIRNMKRNKLRLESLNEFYTRGKSAINSSHPTAKNSQKHGNSNYKRIE
jgi:hypothetical protein